MCCPAKAFMDITKYNAFKENQPRTPVLTQPLTWIFDYLGFDILFPASQNFILRNIKARPTTIYHGMIHDYNHDDMVSLVVDG